MFAYACYKLASSYLQIAYCNFGKCMYSY